MKLKEVMIVIFGVIIVIIAILILMYGLVVLGYLFLLGLVVLVFLCWRLWAGAGDIESKV